MKQPCSDRQDESGGDAFARIDHAGAVMDAWPKRGLGNRHHSSTKRHRVIDRPDMNGSRRIAGLHGVSILAAISDGIVAITGGTSAQPLENR